MHLYLWLNGVRNQSVGPMFLVNVVAGVVIAVLLVRWNHWIPAFLTLGFGLSTLGAFITSTTVGLFGVNEQWDGWAVWTAAISEAIAIVTGAVLLLRDNPLKSRSQLQDGVSSRSAHLH